MEFVISEQEYIKFDPETGAFQICVFCPKEKKLDTFIFLLLNTTTLDIVNIEGRAELRINRCGLTDEKIISRRFVFSSLKESVRESLAEFLFQLFKLTHYKPNTDNLLDI